MRKNLGGVGVAVLVVGAVMFTSIARGEEPIGIIGAVVVLAGLVLMWVSAGKLSDRGRAYLNGAMALCGLGLLAYGIYRFSLVADDDEARIQLSEELAAVTGGGALMAGLGLSSVLKRLSFVKEFLGE